MTACRTAAVTVSLVCALLCACSPQPPAGNAAGAAAPAAVAKVDAKKLVGRWQRPDGGYVLEIAAATDDGKLDAKYLNPNPINVASAVWRVSEQGLLIVAVELRDVNYPGAKYTLRFDPAADKLAGAYFQPVYNETYEIEFVRLQP